MSLQQINVTYDARQDRLLVRMNTSEHVEYRFWITRRLVKGLWQGLVRRMQSTETARRQMVHSAKQAVVEFEREAALRKTRFDKPYAAGELRPAMPGEPLLVFSITMRSHPKGGHDIGLMPASGAGFHLRFSDTLLHGFAKLLQDAVKLSGWNLALELPRASVTQRASYN